MNILFRTSGGQKEDLGLGHVYRCLHLASCLKPHKIHFIIEDYGKVKELLQERGYKNIFQLKKGIELDADIKETIQYIKQNRISILIIDKYHVKHKYLKEVGKFTKVVLISILRRINYPVDLVVNGFIGFENKITLNKYGTRCLLGPSYEILSKKYSKKMVFRKKKYALLATFGGFDKNNIVEILCKSLAANMKKIKIKIILGPATVKSHMIQDLEKKYSRYLTIVNKTNDMRKEISTAEFGICSGGITTYEFAVMNVPFAIVCQYKHQLQTAREWEKRGIALNLGMVNSHTQNKIQKFLEDILKRKFFRNPVEKRIVDGLGTQRVASEILKLKSS